MNTTHSTSPALSIDQLHTLSRGLGRYAARTTIGTAPYVIQRALDKARALLPTVDAKAFMDGWADEREALRGAGAHSF
jgi:hypothetical protein